ncbi:MAG: hypothetical protein ACOY0S_04800 [Patescibacteria group bacterium]
MKLKKIVIRDTNDVKNIFVQVDITKGSTMVMSNFSAWENLAYLLEALAVTAEQCITEGMSKRKVYDEIKRYLMNVLGEYHIC